MNLFMSFLGRFIAMLPRSFSKALCDGIGWLVAEFPTSRKRVILANLRHCFPDISDEKLRYLCIESCRRTIEMGLFVLASPYIKLEELKKRVKLSEYLKAEMKRFEANPKPLVLMIPHFCMMESITIMPAIAESKMPKTGVFYRPFDNPGMEKWIKNTREKYGINLLSRRDGLLVANDYIRRGDCVSILFDQDAGGMGALSMFFDRVCSCSEIAGLLIERTKCMSGIFWARRTGFWESEIDAQYFEYDSAENVIIKANRWLEDTLKKDESLCADWLWLHKRWKAQSNPLKRFRLEHRKSHLENYKKFYNLKELPRATHFFVNLASDESKLLPNLVAIEALRKSRPDVALDAICFEESAEFLKSTKLFESVKSFSNDRDSQKELLNSIKKLYPDVLINFENSKFSMFIKNAIKPLQTYAFVNPKEKTNANCVFTFSDKDRNLPYLKKLEIFMKHFGLQGEFNNILSENISSQKNFLVALKRIESDKVTNS